MANERRDQQRGWAPRLAAAAAAQAGRAFAPAAHRGAIRRRAAQGRLGTDRPWMENDRHRAPGLPGIR
jgi:hypothetical protein